MRRVSEAGRLPPPPPAPGRTVLTQTFLRILPRMWHSRLVPSMHCASSRPLPGAGAGVGWALADGRVAQRCACVCVAGALPSEGAARGAAHRACAALARTLSGGKARGR